LKTASGFQSLQFRLLENKFGVLHVRRSVVFFSTNEVQTLRKVKISTVIGHGCVAGFVLGGRLKVKLYNYPEEVVLEIRSVTCHMGSPVIRLK